MQPTASLTPEPHSDPPGELIGLSLSQVVTRTFPRRGRYEPEMLRYLADLATLFELPDETERLATDGRVTFTEMAQAMLPALRGDGQPIGLVVLAHSTPDSEPTWPACYLSAELPGQPMAFAVADQGSVAPFTALRIAASYIGSGGLRRAAVLILDQSTLLAEPAAELPAQDRAVALILDARGEIGEARVDVRGGVRAADLPAVLAELSQAEADEPAPIVVAGAGLAEAVATIDTDAGHGEGRTVLAPSGLPCTGPWQALAAGLPGWQLAGARRVVVVDHDDPPGSLGICSLELYPRG